MPPRRVEPSALPAPSLDAFGEPYRFLRLGKLKYLELITGGADPDASLPIVVLIHGLGDHPRVPSEPRGPGRPLRLLYPEGPDPFDVGRAWTHIRTREARPQDMAADLRHTANELDLFLDGVATRYQSPCKPILAGFSQGGSVTWAYAVLRPERPLAAFPMAAWLPGPLVEQARRERERLPPIRMMHGEQDETVPFSWTAAIVDSLVRDGASLPFEAVPEIGHRFVPIMQTRLYEWIDGAVGECLGPASGPGVTARGSLPAYPRQQEEEP